MYFSGWWEGDLFAGVEDKLRSLSFRLYGLPPWWHGTRALGDMGTWPQEDITYEVGLTHGDVLNPAEPLLEVLSALPIDSSDDVQWDLRMRLRGEIKARPDLAGPGPKRRVTVTVSVEGRPVQLEGLQRGEVWVAETQYERQNLALLARGWDSEGIELVEITDLAPYLRGRAEMLQRGRHDPEPP
jgi:hypothetical protein